MKNSERLGEARRNSGGCEPHGQRGGGSGGVRAARAGMGWEQWEWWERWECPRTPEGGLAGKGLRRVWRIGGIFGKKLGGTGRGGSCGRG